MFLIPAHNGKGIRGVSFIRHCKSLTNKGTIQASGSALRDLSVLVGWESHGKRCGLQSAGPPASSHAWHASARVAFFVPLSFFFFLRPSFTQNVSS